MSTASGVPDNDPRGAALANYRKKLLEHREMEAKVKDCTHIHHEQNKQGSKLYCALLDIWSRSMAFTRFSFTHPSPLSPSSLSNYLVRMGLKELDRTFDKSEDDIKALQSVGQIIGSVLKQLDEDRCEF
jgi:26S proteasome regulatory subunit T4